MHGLRAHLVGLTGRLDAFTALHRTHAQTLLGQSQDMSKKVVECSGGLVRAELEICEGLARKGWAGGGLEELLERGQDPFAGEDDRRGVAGNGASSVNGLVPTVDQSLGMPRNGEHRAVRSADAESVAVADGHDHDETSIFDTDAANQQMALFSPSPGFDSAPERHTSVWESERPLKKIAAGEDSLSIPSQFEDSIPEETEFENVDAGKQELR